MTLEFTDADQPIKVKTLICTITAPPGVGKTSLSSTLPGAVLVDADQGAHRTPYRAARLSVQTWDDVLAVPDHKSLQEGAPAVVDTIGRVVDIAAAQIVKEGAKGTVYNGALSMQGYGVLRSRMIPWLSRMRGRDLILLSHQREEKKKDDLIVRPDVVGGTLQEVLRSSDLIGYLSMVGRERVLDFDPTEDRLGKNSAGFEPFKVPDLSKGKSTFLADLLAEAKARMNRQSEDSIKAESQVADFAAQIETCKDGEDLLRVLDVLQSPLVTPAVSAQAKSLLLAQSKKLGFAYNRTTKAFEKAA